MRRIGWVSGTGAVRYRLNSARRATLLFRGLMGVKLALGIWVVWISADDLATGSWAPSARPWAPFFLVLGAVLIGVASWMLARSGRPALAIDGDFMRIQRVVNRTQRWIQVAVSEVTGVGLVFRRLGVSGSGWYLMVWHGAERGEPVYIRYVPVLRSGRDVRGAEKLLAAAVEAPGDGPLSPFDLATFDPATQTDSAKLAATYAGRVARDIYQRVLARQGPAGPLASTEQQKHVRVADSLRTANVSAYWSPDGAIGRTETLTAI
jgi:hypothetical protein